jgi:hypothetical protein
MRSTRKLTESVVAEDDGENIPDLLPPPLPDDVALRLAHLAHVPLEEHEAFFDMLHWTMALVCMRDRRVLGTSAGPALIRVAKAARALHQEFSKLNPLDRKWVERLWRRTFWYRDWLRDVPETVFRISHLFSSAAGISPPRGAEVAKPDNQKSSRDRTRADPMFLDFVCRLRMIAHEAGGKLGLDPNNERGKLVEAVEMLKPHLPHGFVPERFPFFAIKKLKVGTLAAPIPEIDFYSPEPPA